MADGRPLAMYGVKEIAGTLVGERRGMAWCLSCEAVDELPILFFRTSRAVLEALLQRFDVLVALVAQTYYRARAWLRRLGFVETTAVDVSSGATYLVVERHR
jgi:hypothetical protein